MTEIEIVKTILKECCYCLACSCYDGFSCRNCPAERIRKEKGLNCCIDLWGDNDYKKKEWFENFLKEAKMTEIEVAKIIFKNNGDCHYINYCRNCPADRIKNEKRLSNCGGLFDYNYKLKIQWFENWLKENGDKMKTEKIKELREKLQNITDEQLETIADIIYDQVVDPEQHIIDAFNEYHNRYNHTNEESLFEKKVNAYGFSQSFYAGFKAAEKMYKK